MGVTGTARLVVTVDDTIGADAALRATAVLDSATAVAPARACVIFDAPDAEEAVTASKWTAASSSRCRSARVPGSSPSCSVEAHMYTDPFMTVRTTFVTAIGKTSLVV